MPKLVCTQCQTELYCEKTGVVVVEMASFGPYKVWMADLYKCKGCGIEVVGGFADQPMRSDHYADDFEKWLNEVQMTASKIVLDYEKPSPVEEEA